MLEMQFAEADAAARLLGRMAPLARRLNRGKLDRMKPVLVFTTLLLLAACASQNENPPNPAATKAEIKARDDFAKSLPKPPER